MTHDAFTTLRRYTRAEVASCLHIPETWLKEWVTDDAVPHQRSGRVRGVWFTYADMLRIGSSSPR